jgi:branched-chain amino acid aminotransferase
VPEDTVRVTRTVVWCDGRLRSPDEAVVGPLDRGLTGGFGVYESCAVLDGQVFALRRHLARFARSATTLGLPVPDEMTVRQAAEQVAAAGGWAYGRLRLTLTGGPADGTPGVLLVVGQPAATVETVALARSPWVRNERSAIAGAKATSTADNLVAARFARRSGADEAVLANTRGELCECTTANVLVEIGGELVTPPLTSGCLGGVTRELLLGWAAEEGMPVRERTLDFAVLDEVFAGRAALAISSTVRTVVPVTALDGVPVAPGPLTVQARRLFQARRRERLDP